MINFNLLKRVSENSSNTKEGKWMPNRDKPVKRMEKEILKHDLITKYPLKVENFQDFIQR